MAKKRSAQRAKARAQEQAAAEALRLRWATVVCSVAALVFSLLPWALTPEWLSKLDALTSNTNLAIDVAGAYGPLNFADLATELGSAFDEPSLTWMLGAAEALWVAGLTFIVLGVGGTITHRIFGDQQLRRFLAWGSAFTIGACVVSIAFSPISGSAFFAHFSEVHQGLAGYLAYVGGAEVTNQGFGMSAWLFLSLGFAAVAFGCAIAETIKVQEER